jgi:serine/threonine protein phosphatase PrpC
MDIQVWCQTDIGLRRQSNEDSFLIDESLGLFLVADGMGGHRGGEVASAMAVATLREVIHQHSQDKRQIPPRLSLVNAYREASQRIFERSRAESAELQGMGTTLVAAYTSGTTVYIANVGDSRAYLFSQAKLWQITEDHSLLNEQLRAGLLHENDVPNFASKNVITRSVGFEREVSCDIIEREFAVGEILLICSDGLSGLVSDEKIAQLITDNAPQDIVSKCIQEARQNGGYDNITVMVLRRAA